ncbi:hypothetical protein FG379_003297 [Cryptosporidium bovis]|uniref:uncharacterized protein n=1 Tax=Cryptosporidium bovis TaxID=310047 RepID=UPI00351A589A|nr:hypothetical protein FG379_003297 [Cryptosporidium bovis]
MFNYKIFICLAFILSFSLKKNIRKTDVETSLLKIQSNEYKNLRVDYFEIPSNIPKLYPSLSIITINPLIVDYQSKQRLTTDIELVISCYEELPNYLLKKGLLNNYLNFIKEVFTTSCNIQEENNSTCEGMKKTINVINEVVEKLEAEYTLKTNSCFEHHTRVASAHEIKKNFYNNRSQRTNLTERAIKREKMIFSLRQVTYFENFYLKLRIKYEKYCINHEKYEESDILDCRLILDSCIIFEKKIPTVIALLNKYYNEYLNIKRE